MKQYRVILLVALCLPIAQRTFAQTSAETASALPRLVRFSGTTKDPSGNPRIGVVGITFALYSEQSGGAALWLETQNVTADGNGRYTALLGATKPQGLPADLFNNEQAHWVGVQVEGQPEQPRVLLVSSPYALKAGDAETIGGLPPSAFVLAVSSAGAAASALASPAAASASTTESGATGSVTGTGTTDFVPLWTTTSNLGSSVLFQSGTGATAKVGINTTLPAATLDVKGGATIRGTLGLPASGTATATAGQNSQVLNMQASVFNSGTGTAVPQTFQLRAEPIGNDTATASGALSLLYGSGSNVPAETGLKIANTGLITFATGQTFPGVGSGTVTSVGSGAGLTGGPITSSGSLSVAAGGVSNAMLANPSLTVSAGTDLQGGGLVALGGGITINLDTNKVPQLAAPNTFTANQTVNGAVTATSFSGNGSALTNLQGTNVQGTVPTATNALELGGLLPGAYATTGSNTFAGNQSVTGNVAATGSLSGASATFTGPVTEAGAVLPAIGTATATQSYNSQPLDSVASAYNSSTASAQNQDFQWQAEPAGSNTSAPSATLNLLFGANGAPPAETGFSIANSGLITFVNGQTFPGAGGGTITSVIAGTDLTGGGSTGAVTLNLDINKVPQLAIANNFMASQNVNGTVTATSFSGNGSALTNLQGTNVQGTVASAANALELGGLLPSAYATTSSNTFTGNQSVTGNVTATGSVSGASATFTGPVIEAGALLPASGTATATQSYNSQPLDLVASAYNSGTANAQSQDFRWLAEPVGSDSGSPSGKLNLLFGASGATPAETGLSIASNGVLSFVSAQTFPGAGGGGTVTSVGSGAGLTGGPITTTGTLSIATGGVSNAMLANSSVTVQPGTDLLGGGLVALGGITTLNLDTSKVPQLIGPNTFSATQTVSNGDVLISNGNLDLAATSSSGFGVITMSNSPYIHSCCTLSNVFVGNSSGNFSNPGGTNTAVGASALAAINGGTSNTATGSYALQSNTTASGNTADGYFALGDNSTGSQNTAVGYQALADNNGTTNTAVGYYALRNITSGSNNIGIGSSAGDNVTTTSNNIYIGNQGVAGDSNVIRIGTCCGPQTAAYIAGIYGVTSSGGVEVFINSSGQLGTVQSSRRYKEDIQDMADASSGLLRLRPVTFRYKKPDGDGSQPIQYGLIAEEVAEVYPDLVARSADGQIETVKYHLLGPMLLNELQKQNATIAAQKEQIQAQEQQIQSLEERLARVEAALQRIPASAPPR